MDTIVIKIIFAKLLKAYDYIINYNFVKWEIIKV